MVVLVCANMCGNADCILWLLPILLCVWLDSCVYASPIRCRSNNLSYFSLDCKMRWSRHHICKCFMLRQLLVIISASLWSFLLACIWILGWQVVITTGEQFSNFLNSMPQCKRKTRKMQMVIFFSSCCVFKARPVAWMG